MKREGGEIIFVWKMPLCSSFGCQIFSLELTLLGVCVEGKVDKGVQSHSQIAGKILPFYYNEG
jgi:hypothetical protein